jgi:hypothetical protein
MSQDMSRRKSRRVLCVSGFGTRKPEVCGVALWVQLLLQLQLAFTQPPPSSIHATKTHAARKNGRTSHGQDLWSGRLHLAFGRNVLNTNLFSFNFFVPQEVRQ